MSTYKDVKDFFKKNIHVKFDVNFLKELTMFRLRWSTKSDDYIEFLGSHEMGTHTIRFSDLDDEALMSIYQVKDLKWLQEEFYKVPGINKQFKVASNVIYNLLAYTAHVYITSKFPQKIREKGVIEPCLIMQYKMITSLYSKYFKYATTPAIAISVYERLSHKFLLKKLGSWQAVFEFRARYCLDKKSPLYKKLIRFTTEDSVTIVTDTQTKIRSMLKTMYHVLIRVLEEKDLIASDSDTFVGGEKGEKQVKDSTNMVRNMINEVANNVYIPDNFIIDGLVKVIHELVPNIPPDLIKKYLECMSNEEINNPKTFIPIVEKIIIISTKYLQRLDVNFRDPAEVAIALESVRFYWSSSKVKNKEMDEIKKYLQELAARCTGIKTKWKLAALAIAGVTYIFARSLKA